MLKYFLYLVLIIVCVSIFHNLRVAYKNQKEMAQFSKEQVLSEKKFGKTLVIYYSMTGKTKDIAQRIQKLTNADVYEIKTKENFSIKSFLTHAQIIQQIRNKDYPPLIEDFPKAENYDYIFVGAPVWWYTVATPALGFLQKFDFKNKKVIPFSTQGSNYGTFFEDFEKAAQNATLLKGEAFNNLSKKYDYNVDNKIKLWLNSL